MQEKPKVLIVEDDPRFQERARAILGPYADLIIVASLNKAAKAIRENPDLFCVILDVNIRQFEGESRIVQSYPLVYVIQDYCKEGIPIFAASSENNFNQKLVDMACVDANKETAPLKVRDLIFAEK